MRYLRAKVITASILLPVMLGMASGVALALPLLRPGHHTLVGELIRVDRKAGKLIVRTADGTEHVVAYTGRTAIHGLEQATHASYLAGKEGSQVVVHYTQRGATMSADQVDVFGHAALHETDGTLVAVNKDGRHVVIRTKDGADHTYELSQNAAIDTSRGIINTTDLAAKRGDHVVVYHTEQGSHVVIHAFKDLGHKIY
jgi:hypothetical protein